MYLLVYYCKLYVLRRLSIYHIGTYLIHTDNREKAYEKFEWKEVCFCYIVGEMTPSIEKGFFDARAT